MFMIRKSLLFLALIENEFTILFLYYLLHLEVFNHLLQPLCLSEGIFSFIYLCLQLGIHLHQHLQLLFLLLNPLRSSNDLLFRSPPVRALFEHVGSMTWRCYSIMCLC